MDKALCATLEKMTVEKGSKEGNIYKASFSVREVLERMGKPFTEKEKNYVVYVVNRFYDKAKVGPANGNDGGTIHMRIWSK